MNLILRATGQQPISISGNNIPQGITGGIQRTFFGNEDVKDIPARVGEGNEWLKSKGIPTALSGPLSAAAIVGMTAIDLTGGGKKEGIESAGKGTIKFLGGNMDALPKVIKNVLKGPQDYTTSFIKKLVSNNKNTINQGELKNLLNNTPGVDKYDLKVINDSAAEYGDKIPTQSLINDISAEILPLTPWKNPTPTTRGSSYFDYTPKSLLDHMGGKGYNEITFESPIKTSAGEQHPMLGSRPGYFSHYRYEDLLPENIGTHGSTMETQKLPNTRRQLEIQADLTQHDRLPSRLKSIVEEKWMESPTFLEEYYKPGNIVGSYYGDKDMVLGFNKGVNGEWSVKVAEIGKRGQILGPERIHATFPTRDNVKYVIDRNNINLDRYLGDASKLNKYKENPKAQIRTFREALKLAAKDGKTTYEWPTGQTAMKIEGLGGGQDNLWVDWPTGRITAAEVEDLAGLMPDDIKRYSTGDTIGRLVNRGNMENPWTDVEPYIITGTNIDGKFKVIPKATVDDVVDSTGRSREDVMEMIQNRTFPGLINLEESINLSEKLTKEFVYRLNEIDFVKEAKRLGLKPEVVDTVGGGKFWRVSLPNSFADMAVEGKVPIGVLTNMTKATAPLAAGAGIGAGMFKFLGGDLSAVPENIANWIVGGDKIKNAGNPLPVPPPPPPLYPKFTPNPETGDWIEIDKLISGESSNNPRATNIGDNGHYYVGLTQIGMDEWNIVNKYREEHGLPVYEWKSDNSEHGDRTPPDQVWDPDINKEYGNVYLNKIIPEKIERLYLPLNPLMILIMYGGWWDDWKAVGGDIDKMPDTANIYFTNVLGEDVAKYKESVKRVNYIEELKRKHPDIYAQLANK
jgi:hypothetical protein